MHVQKADACVTLITGTASAALVLRLDKHTLFCINSRLRFKAARIFRADHCKPLHHLYQKFSGALYAL